MSEADRRNTIDMLRRVGDGEAGALDDLLPLVYRELHELAQRQLANRRGVVTLQPTQLVHETFLKLLEGAAPEATDRRRFIAIAAGAMRHVLIDEIRRRRAEKRGGGWNRITCSGLAGSGEAASEIDLLALDEALQKMAELDPRQARIVELRFFGGLAGEEIAEELAISRNTVVRELGAARLWLARELDR